VQNASRNQRKRKRLHATQAKIAYVIDVTQSCKCPVKEITPASWDKYFLGKHWRIWALVSLILARFGFINRTTKVGIVYCIVLFLNRNCNFAGHYPARRGFKVMWTIGWGGGVVHFGMPSRWEISLCQKVKHYLCPKCFWFLTRFGKTRLK